MYLIIGRAKIKVADKLVREFSNSFCKEDGSID